MKLEANVTFTDEAAEKAGCEDTVITIDGDYVESTTDDVTHAVEDGLWKKFNKAFTSLDFKVTNMNDLIADLAYDEFEDKTQYSDM